MSLPTSANEASDAAKRAEIEKLERRVLMLEMRFVEAERLISKILQAMKR